MATLAGWMQDNEANLPVKLGDYDQQDSFVRALPNEDVCLWIKTIDNSRVVRHADPKVRNACWRFIGIASVVVLLVVGQLLPAAYRLRLSCLFSLFPVYHLPTTVYLIHPASSANRCLSFNFT